MSNVEIRITKKDETGQEVVDTDGYLLLYVEGTKIRMKGQLDIKLLTPLITKAILEKMSR